MTARGGHRTQATRAPGETALQAELDFADAQRKLAAGELTAALDLAKRGQRKARASTRAEYTRLVGLALLALGKARESVREFERALTAFRARRRSDLEVRTMFDLARAYAALDAPNEAIPLARACDERLQSGLVVDRHFELEVQRFLANSYIRIGDQVSADLRFERALAIAADVADPTTLANLYAGLAVVRTNQKDLEAALRYTQLALEAHRHLGHAREVAQVWNNLGWIYTQRGQFEKAQEALARADRDARALNYAPLLATVIASRAELALARGEWREAIAVAAQLRDDAAAPSLARATAALTAVQALDASGRPLAEVLEAFEVVRRVQAEQPRHVRAAAHQRMFEILARRNEFELAVEQARVTLELASGSPIRTARRAPKRGTTRDSQNSAERAAGDVAESHMSREQARSLMSKVNEALDRAVAATQGLALVRSEAAEQRRGETELRLDERLRTVEREIAALDKLIDRYLRPPLRHARSRMRSD